MVSGFRASKQRARKEQDPWNCWFKNRNLRANEASRTSGASEHSISLRYRLPLARTDDGCGLYLQPAYRKDGERESRHANLVIPAHDSESCNMVSQARRNLILQFWKEGIMFGLKKNPKNSAPRPSLYCVWIRAHEGEDAPLIRVWIDPSMTMFESQTTVHQPDLEAARAQMEAALSGKSKS
jgi:hypothetical protein